MKRYFEFAMLIIGSIVGAGFASGRELVAFFGTEVSPIIAVICGLLVFALSAVFLFIGSKIKSRNVSDINKKIAGKLYVVVDIFILVNSFIVLGGMLAAMDSLGSMVLKIKPAYSVVFGALCVFIVCKGIKGILKCTRIIVPITILALVFVTVFWVKSSGGIVWEWSIPARSVWTSVIYICMNMMLASTVITTVGTMSKKEIFISSAIAGFIMMTLILCLIFAISGTNFAYADMPVLEIARHINPIVFVLVIIVIAISIFTTMLTAMSGLTAWFRTLFGGKVFSAVVVLFAGLALSNIGFNNVVTYLYPVIGTLGVCYAVLGIIYIVKTSLPTKRLGAKSVIKTKKKTMQKTG